MENVTRTTQVSSSIGRACEHCNDLNASRSSDDISDSVNHYIQSHGYHLLHVGTQTSHDSDGKPWHSTIAVLGHPNPPPVKPPVEIRIEHVFVDPKPQ
jgi:hypothetical protein